MKNTIRRMVTIALIFSVGLVTTNCFGGFALTKKIYNWNDSMDNKFVKTLVFWGLNIIPVYGVGVLLDAVIFNLIEFWSGSNPIAMADGDMEEQHYAHKGVDYRITATKNQFLITTLSGNDEGKVEILRFDASEKAWYYEHDGISTALLHFSGTDYSDVAANAGEGAQVNFNTDNLQAPLGLWARK